MTSASVGPTVRETQSARSVEVAAVVFDADGVLVDTEPAWGRARAALFNQHGREFTEAEDRQTLGTGIAGTSQALSKLLGEPDKDDELRHELLTLLIVEISKNPPHPLPGAVELVDELRGRVPIGVASNSPHVSWRSRSGRLNSMGSSTPSLGSTRFLMPSPRPTST